MKKIITIVLFFLAAACSAQSSKLRFEHIATEQGLSQLSVKSIVQDYLGFMWFCTDDGLNRFDGYKCKVYRYNPSEQEGLKSNLITVICEDENKDLWVGTQNGGLYKYNREHDKFIFVPIDPGSAEGYGNKIMALYSSGNYLWIGSREGGVFKYSLRSGEVEKHLNTGSGLTSNYITNIAGDHNGGIWIGTGNNGLNYISPNSGKIVHYASGMIIFSLAPGIDDYIWFTTGSELKRLNPVTREIKNYSYSEDSTAKSGSVFFVYTAERGEVWGAASEGLIKYNGEKDRFINVSVGEKNPFNTLLRSIYITGDNVLWAGTISSGVYKIDLTPNKFHHFLNETDAGFSAPGMSIIQDREGHFWAGTFGHGLFQLDENKKLIKSFHQNNFGEKNYIFCLLEDSDGNIWYGTIFKGLFRYNKKTGELKNFNPANSSLNSRGISFLHMDGDSNIWAGTYIMGLFKYDKENDDFISYNSDEASGFNLSDKGIYGIYSDSRSNLWIGTESNGLDRIDRKNNTSHNYRHIPGNKKSPSHNHIISFKEDSKGNLWIGTYAGGLNKFDYQTETFKYYTIEEGLPNNSIYSIIEDDEGYLWLSTNYGISRLDPGTETFTNYTAIEGLPSNEFAINSGCRTASGEILFGSIEGFVGFNPGSFTEADINYRIVATSFKIGNKNVQAGNDIRLEKNITVAEKVNLTYADNLIEFEFVALNFDMQKSLKYAYKMEGFDSDWIITSSDKRFATYTNLDPGEYNFKVKAVDRSGNFSMNEASVLITISPPYWQTWWFYTLVVLLIASALYSIYRYRINKILELERLRVGIASDLHDDIGSTLTKLALKADMIQHDIDTEDKYASLQRISEMSRQAVSTMSDIVWSIDSRNDSFESLINKMKDFAFSVLSSKEVKVDFNTAGFDETKKLPLEVRQNLYLILKEAVNNIAKHSDASEVAIVLSSNRDEFKLAVKDNGSCYKEKAIVGQGLKNMKMRAEKINADIEYKIENGFEIYVTGKF